MPLPYRLCQGLTLGLVFSLLNSCDYLGSLSTVAPEHIVAYHQENPDQRYYIESDPERPELQNIYHLINQEIGDDHKIEEILALTTKWNGNLEDNIEYRVDVRISSRYNQPANDVLNLYISAPVFGNRVGSAYYGRDVNTEVISTVPFPEYAETPSMISPASLCYTTTNDNAKNMLLECSVSANDRLNIPNRPTFPEDQWEIFDNPSCATSGACNEKVLFGFSNAYQPTVDSSQYGLSLTAIPPLAGFDTPKHYRVVAQGDARSNRQRHMPVLLYYIEDNQAQVKILYAGDETTIDLNRPQAGLRAFFIDDTLEKNAKNQGSMTLSFTETSAPFSSQTITVDPHKQLVEYGIDDVMQVNNLEVAETYEITPYYEDSFAEGQRYPLLMRYKEGHRDQFLVLDPAEETYYQLPAYLGQIREFDLFYVLQDAQRTERITLSIAVPGYREPMKPETETPAIN